MSTPRTIAACEVRKGMRVRVEQRFTHPPVVSGGQEDKTVETIEGTVIACENANIEFPNGRILYCGYDTPVTVLAEPEPEWVEGAWYRCKVNMTGDGVKLLRRGIGGWTSFEAGPWTYQDAAVTVLGRVLIVDWPGDDVARAVLGEFPEDHMAWMSPTNIAGQKVADAIRTQGGVR